MDDRKYHFFDNISDDDALAAYLTVEKRFVEYYRQILFQENIDDYQQCKLRALEVVYNLYREVGREFSTKTNDEKDE